MQIFGFALHKAHQQRIAQEFWSIDTTNLRLLIFLVDLMLLNLLIVALLGTSAVFADEGADAMKEAADYVKSLDEFDHEWKHECHLGSGEGCDLRNFPKDETTMVFPGGETRCIFSNTPNFAFQVRTCR